MVKRRDAVTRRGLVGSVEQSCDPTENNRIRSLSGRTGGTRSRSPQPLRTAAVSPMGGWCRRQVLRTECVRENRHRGAEIGGGHRSRPLANTRTTDRVGRPARPSQFGGREASRNCPSSPTRPPTSATRAGRLRFGFLNGRLRNPSRVPFPHGSLTGRSVRRQYCRDRAGRGNSTFTP